MELMAFVVLMCRNAVNLPCPLDLEPLLLRHRNKLKDDEQVLYTGVELSTSEEKLDINSLEFVTVFL